MLNLTTMKSRIAAVCIFVATAPGVGAIPIVAVDATPQLAGIQDVRTVTLGETFDVRIVVDNNNSAGADFNSIIFDLFQDTLFDGAVTTRIGQATAGTLATTPSPTPIAALDVFGAAVAAVRR